MAHEQTAHLMESSTVPSMRSWSAARASSALHTAIRMSPVFWMLYDAAIAVGALFLGFFLAHEWSSRMGNVEAVRHQVIVAQSQAIAFPLLVLLAGKPRLLDAIMFFHYSTTPENVRIMEGRCKPPLGVTRWHIRRALTLHSS